MKKGKWLVVIIAVCMSVMFTACGASVVPEVPVTISFDSNGGSEVESMTLTSQDVFAKPEDPTKTGYDFAGWTLRDADFAFDRLPSDDVTLVAKWTAKSYTLSFGGVDTPVQSMSVTYDSAIGQLPQVPAKTGYDAGVWKIGDDELSDSTVWNYAENKTALAVYSGISYSLSFSGADSPVDGITVKFGSAMSNLPQVPERAGYDGVWKIDDDELTSETVWDYTEDKTATAVYSEKDYTLSFSGADSSVDGITVTYLAEIADLPQVPERAGYDGVWKIGDDELSTETVWNYTENKTATAVYTEKTFDLTLDKLDGETDGTATVVFGATSLTITAAPVYDGHIIVGYLSDEFGDRVAKKDGTLIANIDGLTDGDGKWIATEVTELYPDYRDEFVRAEGAVADFEQNGETAHYGVGNDGLAITKDDNVAFVTVSDSWSSDGEYSLRIDPVGDGWALVLTSSHIEMIYDTVSFDIRVIAKPDTDGIEGIEDWTFNLRVAGDSYGFDSDLDLGDNHITHTFDRFFPEYQGFECRAIGTDGCYYYIDKIVLSSSTTAPEFERAEGAMHDFEKKGETAHYGVDNDGFAMDGNGVANVSMSTKWSSDGYYSLKVQPYGDGWAAITTSTAIQLEWNTIEFDVYASQAIEGWKFEPKVGGSWKTFATDLVQGVNHVKHTYSSPFTQYNGFDCRASAATEKTGTYYIDKIVLSLEIPEVPFTRAEGAVHDFEKNGEIDHFGVGNNGFAMGNGNVSEVSISSEWASDGQYSFKVRPTGNGWAAITTTTPLEVSYNTISFDIYVVPTEDGVTGIKGWEFETKVGTDWKKFSVDLVAGVNHVTHTYDTTFTQYNGFDCRAWNDQYCTYYIDKVVLSTVEA